jgi:hypothetical protein
VYSSAVLHTNLLAGMCILLFFSRPYFYGIEESEVYLGLMCNQLMNYSYFSVTAHCSVALSNLLNSSSLFHVFMFVFFLFVGCVCLVRV